MYFPQCPTVPLSENQRIDQVSHETNAFYNL